MEQDLDQDHKQDLDQDLDQNQKQDMDQDQKQDMDQNQKQDMDQNPKQDMYQIPKQVDLCDCCNFYNNYLYTISKYQTDLSKINEDDPNKNLKKINALNNFITYQRSLQGLPNLKFDE